MNISNIIVITTGMESINLISLLHSKQLVKGVVIPGAWGHIQHHLNEQLRAAGIPCFPYGKDNINQTLQSLQDISPDLGLMFFCSEKLDSDIYRIPGQGVINIHASPLPEYRGAQPIYWQIRNGETRTALTAHIVDSSLDTGPVVAQKLVEIDPYDTHHCVLGRMSEILPSLIDEIIDKAADGFIDRRPQTDQCSNLAPRINQDDLHIDWSSITSEALCNQVRAGSPHLGGAHLFLGQSVAQLLQASASDISNFDTPPGTIVRVSPGEGLIVALKEGCIRLDIVANSEGVFDGYRYACLYDFKAGMQFHKSPLLNQQGH